MLICCNGMPRSASTWSFNVVMQLLRHTYPHSTIYGGYDEDFGRFLASAPVTVNHAVLKCHTLDAVGKALAQIGAAKFIYTWRNIEDAIASCMLMFGYSFDHSLDLIGKSLELYHFHLQHKSALVIGYAEVIKKPGPAIGRIAEYLGMDHNPNVIHLVAKETSLEAMREKVEGLEDPSQQKLLIPIENTAYHPEHLLHPRHIRNGGFGYGHKLLDTGQRQLVNELIQKHDCFRVENELAIGYTCVPNAAGNLLNEKTFPQH